MLKGVNRDLISLPSLFLAKNILSILTLRKISFLFKIDIEGKKKDLLSIRILKKIYP